MICAAVVGLAYAQHDTDDAHTATWRFPDRPALIAAALVDRVKALPQAPDAILVCRPDGDHVAMMARMYGLRRTDIAYLPGVHPAPHIARTALGLILVPAAAIPRKATGDHPKAAAVARWAAEALGRRRMSHGV